MSQRTDESFEIGTWRVRGELHRIERAGEVVRLEPKVMGVLLQLAERPGHVVSRDELMDTVWPNVVVGDNALTQVVNKLRKALGDDAAHPQYIEAVQKKGYRLIAPVRTRVVSPESRVTRGADFARFALLAAGAVLVVATLLGGDTATETSPALNADRVGPPLVYVGAFQSGTPDTGLLANALGAAVAAELSKAAELSVTRTAPRVTARYTLDGVVAREGQRVRLDVALTDAHDGTQIWVTRIEAPSRDLFELQDDLARRVSAELPSRLRAAEDQRLAQRSTRSLEAYRLFTAAQAAMQVRRPQENSSARALYWAAIDRDPAFARAYAGLAMSEALEYQQGWTHEEQALDRAQQFARTAVRLRPDMPEAHWVLAFVAVQRREQPEAFRRLDEALRLDPGFADAYALRGGLYTYAGQPQRGVEALHDALRLNPDAGSLYLLLLGRAYFFLGDLEQARFNLERALDRNADNVEARLYLAAVDARRGDRNAAQWQLTEVLQREPAFDVDRWLGHYPLTDEGMRSLLRDDLRSALRLVARPANG